MEVMSREKKTVKVVEWRMKKERVEIDPEWMPLSSDVLYLRIKIRQITSCSDENHGDEPAVYDSTSQRCFPVSARLLRGEDEDDEEEAEAELKAEQAVSSMLSEMELTPQRHQTAHDRIVRKIIYSCRSSDSVSVAGTVQLITAQILVCTILSSELIERAILEEDEDEEDRCCSICLEKLPIGKSVMRMACGHVYHTPCILRWLQTSNFCPLCRFRCPFFDS